MRDTTVIIAGGPDSNVRRDGNTYVEVSIDGKRGYVDLRDLKIESIFTKEQRRGDRLTILETKRDENGHEMVKVRMHRTGNVGWTYRKNLASSH